MANINVAFFRPNSNGNYSVIGPIRVSENISSSGTSAQSTNTAQGNEVCLITAQGSVYVAVGEDPTATSSDLLILQNTSVPIYVPSGQKIAVIDA